ncbi:translocation/assembly module TamB domain-containing protein [Sulfurospirillum sp. T05]|uniref:Translocation/assembly module TamB domain-containing protein n=1 Tax=Sulfurospirillum tamanense TaxID=2813362 RepID=A0ABS2WPE9_9BACT|nr:translocation/assembly module TamB domain-containing protein [Sulfurospirillum tamanensis]MBN2963571.1 translocation/assembly module TamB domain-containing protein [Sulfurospirillum tamanensis]
MKRLARLLGLLSGLFIFFGLTFWWALTSPFAARFILEKLAHANEASYKKVEGTLWDGIRLEGLSHPFGSIDTLHLSLDLPALLWGELRIGTLELSGVSLENELSESLFSNEQTQAGWFPFHTVFITTLRVRLNALAYQDYRISYLNLQGKGLAYQPNEAPKGTLSLTVGASVGELHAFATLDEYVEAKGTFLPTALPYDFSLAPKDALTFSAQGTAQNVEFTLETQSVDYRGFSEPVSFLTPSFQGTYNLLTHALKATLASQVRFGSLEIGARALVEMQGWNAPTFSLEASAQTNEKTVEELRALVPSFPSFLETLSVQGEARLNANGTQEAVHYEAFLTQARVLEATLSETFVIGTLTNTTLAGTVATQLDTLESSTKLEGAFSAPLNNLEALTFEAKGDTLLSFSPTLQGVLHTTAKGSLEAVTFHTNVAPTSLSFGEQRAQLNTLDIQGKATSKETVFDLKGTALYQKRALGMETKNAILSYGTSRVTLDFAPLVTIEGVELEEIMENAHVLLWRTPKEVHGIFNSSLLEASLSQKTDQPIKGALHVKPFDPARLAELPSPLAIGTAEGKATFIYNNILRANGAFTLDGVTFEGDFIGSAESFKATLSHETFALVLSRQKATARATLDVPSLALFSQSLLPFTTLSPQRLEGAFNASVSHDGTQTRLKITSPHLALEGYGVDAITLAGMFQKENLRINQFDFTLGEAFGGPHTYSLTKAGYIDLATRQGSLEFEGLSLNASFLPQWFLDLHVNDFLLAHPDFGAGRVTGDLHVSAQEEVLRFEGELHAREVLVHYKAPALSIHTDQDIVILTKNGESAKEDYFTAQVALEVALFVDGLTYAHNGVNLNSDGVFYFKKDAKAPLELYGSLHDIAGTYTELGKTYTLERSNLYFRGLSPLDPVLDIHARYAHNEVDISIRISGTQSNPRIYLSSNPIMPQQDILSLLIFGTRLGGEGSSLDKEHRASQVSLFLVNELSKDYAKELGLDVLYFEYDPSNEYIETIIGRNLTDNTVVLIKNKFEGGEAVLQRQLTDKWNAELGARENAGSLDFVYKKRY